MNEILLIAEIVLMFGALLVFKKLFGETGLFLWIGLASVLANIQVTKSIDVFEISATVGNVMFASVFLATDLLRECYGKASAKKGVYVGVVSVVLYLACTQLTLSYAPCDIDISQGAMNTLFSLSPRVCAASLTMFAVANFLDVAIYDKLHKMFDGKKLWLRNNVSTIPCNCLENFGFTFLAFAGVYPTEDVLMIAVSTCAIEAGIALCDTPFLYLGKNIKDKRWSGA